MVHNILPGRERFKKILYLFLISPNCIVCLKGPAGDETYLDGRTNMCCMSVGINICSWKIIKMISISLWKWSHSWSAHPTNQILNRESLSHYPMENCKEEIRLVGAIFFFYNFSIGKWLWDRGSKSDVWDEPSAIVYTKKWILF